jgi:hypothetical protein
MTPFNFRISYSKIRVLSNVAPLPLILIGVRKVDCALVEGRHCDFLKHQVLLKNWNTLTFRRSTRFISCTRRRRRGMLLLENLRKRFEKNRSYSKRRRRLSRDWNLWKDVERILVSLIHLYSHLTTYLCFNFFHFNFHSVHFV